MTKRKPLRWVDFGGQLQMPDCEDCFEYLTQPGMAEAIASVGIENAGGVNVRTMVDQYHERRHQEV